MRSCKCKRKMPLNFIMELIIQVQELFTIFWFAFLPTHKELFHSKVASSTSLIDSFSHWLIPIKMQFPNTLMFVSYFLNFILYHRLIWILMVWILAWCKTKKEYITLNSQIGAYKILITMFTIWRNVFNRRFQVGTSIIGLIWFLVINKEDKKQLKH